MSSFTSSSFSWAYADGEPTCHGVIRQTPEDFRVDEVLGYEPDGEGGHAFLHIRKRNTNTDWLAKRLAEFAQVEPREVGYAGLKDRHAVTTQYFTVHVPASREPDWSELNSEEIAVLSVTRHGKKIRRGSLRANRFEILVRELEGDCEDLLQRLEHVSQQGVPNYFGEQRFGRDGHNIVMARRLLSGEIQERDRHKRGLYLSAARSWLFNLVLSQRVADDCWLRPLSGEALIQKSSRSALSLRVITDEIQARIDKGFLQPSGPMWGKGRSTVMAEAASLEQRVLAGEERLMQGLEKSGLEQERRALRLLPTEFSWEKVKSDALRLRFTLPAGSYATAVLRELVKTTDATRRSATV